MKKTVRRKKQRSTKKLQKGAIGNFFVFLILLVLILAAFSAIGGLPSVSSPTDGTRVVITTPSANNSHNTLQLETFGFTTVTPAKTTAPPPPGTTTGLTIIPPPPLGAPMCSWDDDNGVLVNNTCRCIDLDVICQNGKGYTDSGQPFKIPFGDAPIGYSAGQDPCGTRIAPGSGRYCVAKPVIYLYPTVPTSVNVSVLTSGKVVVSDPHYPIGGWKDVFAKPDGTLEYQNQK